MNLLKKLTFVLIIFALAMPMAANAADIQNCPHMMSTMTDMDTDVPCHGDQDAQQDMQSEDMANMDCCDGCDGCQCMSACSVFVVPQAKFGHLHGHDDYSHYLQTFESFSPEGDKAPPKSFSS